MLPWRSVFRSHRVICRAALSKHCSMATTPVESKVAARQQIKQALKALSLEDMSQQSHAIAERVIHSTFFQQCRSVGLYITCERLREVDTLQILEAAIKAGKRVYVPRVEDRSSNMRLVAISDLSELRPVPPFGILEPEPTTADGQQRVDALSAAEPLELLLMPGLGFSTSGARLGRGGGYYDKMVDQLTNHATQLNSLPPLLVGLSFQQQLMDDIPMSDHDKPVDVLVTPSEVHTCTDTLNQRGWG